MLVIEHLMDHPESIEIVTNWLWREWGEGSSPQFWRILVKNSLSKADLPQTFIAMMGDEVVATVGLWRSDLLNRQDLYPWLAALYVKEEYRNKGIGRKLQSFIVDYAKEMGFKEVYLFSELKLKDYYPKTGWQYFDEGIAWPNERVNIYRKVLTTISTKEE